MKKLFTWFTKFSKIVAIVEYVYKGVLVAVDVVTLVKKEIAEIKPDFHYLGALDKVIDYLNKAAEAIALILKWLGGNVEAVAAAARAEVEAEAVTPDAPIDKLVAVTDDLNKFVQENK